MDDGARKREGIIWTSTYECGPPNDVKGEARAGVSIVFGFYVLVSEPSHHVRKHKQPMINS